MVILSVKKRLIILLLIVLSVLLFPSCSPKKAESADIRTTLSIDSSFSGSRTIVLTFPESVVDPGSESETNLDKVVQKYCPDYMSYAKNITNGKISYSFMLAFSSAHEYVQKTTEMHGTKTIVSFSNPSTVMAHGWKLEESFQSSDLIKWIEAGAEKEGFTSLKFSTVESQTNVSLNNDTQKSSPRISVNCLEGNPIEKIQITTLNQKNVFDRKIVFTISDSTYESIKDSISDYFKNLTDKAASSAKWTQENNSHIYTVQFNDVSIKELEGYTNKLLNTVYCEAEYNDKSVGSTALAEQNSFIETLDFSSYIGNSRGNVPVEFTYSVDGSSELSECQFYDGDEWAPVLDLLDTNQYGHVSAIKISDSQVRLKINDGKQYAASSIEISTTPIEDNKLQKSITFKYDIAAGGNEASDYTKAYFRKLDIGAVQSVEGGKNTCTVTFSGTPEELNTKITDIFGDRSIIKMTSENQFMMLRTMKHYTDHMDLSSLTIGKNVDIPIYYNINTQSGDTVKTFKLISKDLTTQKTTETKSDLRKNESGVISMKFASPDTDIIFDISSPNITEIVFCIIISAIAIIIAVVMIILLKRKTISIGLTSGTSSSGLPGSSGNKLAERKKQDSTLKNKDGKK